MAESFNLRGTLRRGLFTRNLTAEMDWITIHNALRKSLLGVVMSEDKVSANLSRTEQGLRARDVSVNHPLE